MPILQQEPASYPSTLFDQESNPSGIATDEFDDFPRGWWTIYTRSRREKALARTLYANQVPFYLPLVRTDHLYGGRKVKSFVPLFSGYLFMCGTNDERITALASNCISRMLPVDDPTGLFCDLRNINKMIAVGAPITIEDRLQPGRKVRVRNGCFRNLEGIVIERRGKHRLLVVVDYIQKGVSMAIEDFMVEPI